jgi:hypothetical protein
MTLFLRDKTMTTQSSSLRRFVRPLIVLFALSASFQACKGENASPADDDDVVNPGGEANDDGSGGRKATGGSGNTGGRRGSGGSRNLGGEGNDDGSGGTGIVAPPEKEDCPDEPNGDECWDLSECNGVKTIQFLEQCQGECLFGGFDNSKIEGYSGGTLPPLP